VVRVRSIACGESHFAAARSRALVVFARLLQLQFERAGFRFRGLEPTGFALELALSFLVDLAGAGAHHRHLIVDSLQTCHQHLTLQFRIAIVYLEQ
jgi:hypothetical protein